MQIPKSLIWEEAIAVPKDGHVLESNNPVFISSMRSTDNILYHYHDDEQYAQDILVWFQSSFSKLGKATC